MTQKQDNFIVSYNEIGGKTFKIEAPTILEGIEKLIQEKFFMKSKAILSAEKGKLRHEIIIYPANARRMVLNKVYRQLLEKRLMLLLK